MDIGINIVHHDPSGSVPRIVHEIPLTSEGDVYEQGQALRWTQRRGGNYVVEFFIDDEVITEFVTDGAGVIAINEQLTRRGIAA